MRSVDMRHAPPLTVELGCTEAGPPDAREVKARLTQLGRPEAVRLERRRRVARLLELAHRDPELAPELVRLVAREPKLFASVAGLAQLPWMDRFGAVDEHAGLEHLLDGKARLSHHVVREARAYLMREVISSGRPSVTINGNQSSMTRQAINDVITSHQTSVVAIPTSCVEPACF